MLPICRPINGERGRQEFNCSSAAYLPFHSIAELMKRKNRKRLAKEAEIARREAKGDYSHLKVRLHGLVCAQCAL